MLVSLPQLPCGSLAFEQRPFAFNTPAITGKRTAAADHAMARHCQGCGVCRTGLGHGPGGLRQADTRGNFGIAGRRADRDVAQGLPYTLLERSTAQIERQVEALRRRIDESDDLRDEMLEFQRAFDNGASWKAAPQLRGEIRTIIAKEDGAHALSTSCHENGTDQAFPEGKTDYPIGVAGDRVQSRDIHDGFLSPNSILVLV